MSRQYSLPVALLAVALLTAQTLPIRRPDGRASVALSQLQVTAPVSLYVSADGGTTGCSSTSPCATLQRACDQLPLDICDAVTITASADYVGTGCRKEGIRFCSHPGTDGGVVWGSLTITGTQAAYAPADAGTGAGSFSSVAAGSNCTLDVWTNSGAAYNTNELANKWVGVTSGTGSGTGKIWPIKSNTATAITVQSYGDATQPAASSGYQIYQAPGSTINATLGQVVTKGGPATQGTNAGAFELSAIPGTLSNGAGNDRRITIENFNVTGLTCGGSSTTAFVIGNGPINLRHNTGTVCLRASTGGVAYPALERNVVTGGTNVYAGQFSSIGGNHALVQTYNNIAASTVNGTFSMERADAWYSRGNDWPSLVYRVGACHNCVSFCDRLGYIRGGASAVIDSLPAAGAGGFSFDGANFANGDSQPYVFSLANGFSVAVDQNGGPASSVNVTGHAAALTFGSLFIWAPTTGFSGSGTVDIAFSNTADVVTIAAIHASNPKAVLAWDGSRAVESGGTPNLDPAVLATGRSVGQAIQHGTKTLSTGAGTVTFAPAWQNAPDCTCTDGTATNAVKCSATTTTLTVAGTGSDVVTWGCVGDY